MKDAIGVINAACEKLNSEARALDERVLAAEQAIASARLAALGIRDKIQEHHKAVALLQAEMTKPAPAPIAPPEPATASPAAAAVVEDPEPVASAKAAKGR